MESTLCRSLRTHKGAAGGGSEEEGARTQADRAARVRISGGRAHRGPAESGSWLCNQAAFNRSRWNAGVTKAGLFRLISS